MISSSLSGIGLLDPIYLFILSQPGEKDFRTGAQRHRAKKKRKNKNNIGKVKKVNRRG